MSMKWIEVPKELIYEDNRHIQDLLPEVGEYLVETEGDKRYIAEKVKIANGFLVYAGGLFICDQRVVLRYCKLELPK